MNHLFLKWQQSLPGLKPEKESSEFHEDQGISLAHETRSGNFKKCQIQEKCKADN